jgi:uncharacterized protein (TIGR03067 family)
MKSSTAVLVLLSICFMLTSAQAADDRASMNGVWKPAQAELGTRPMPAPVLKNITLKMDGANYQVTEMTERGPSVDKGTLQFDITASPKGMVVRGVDGPNKGKTFPAIYELDGDTLRICYDLSGKKRPAEFKTQPGTLLYLVTYHRVK